MTDNCRGKVAVVIPYYRQRSLLSEAVKSALNQTVSPAEIIIVDDGSEEDVASYLTFADSRIQILQQPNAGPSAARNAGWQASQAEYILFLDADDLLLPDSLSRLLDAAGQTANSVAVMGFERFHKIPGDFPESRRVPPPQWQPLPSLLYENISAIHGVLAPRVALESVNGFDERNRYCEDWDLWVRLALQGFVFQPVSFAGALYRVGSQSLSSDSVRMVQGHTRILQMVADRAIAKPDALGYLLPLLLHEMRIRLHRYWRESAPRRDWIDVYCTLKSIDRASRPRPTSLAKSLLRLLPFRLAESLRFFLFSRYENDESGSR